MALKLHEVLLLTQPQDFVLLRQVARECNMSFEGQLSVFEALAQIIIVGVVSENREQRHNLFIAVY